MSILIELKVNGVTVDGAEAWWDDVETAMRGRRDEFPALSQIDPYGDMELCGDQLTKLALELERLALDPRTADISLLQKIASLCERAAAEPGSILTFTGD
jgi:hypothetical protein